MAIVLVAGAVAAWFFVWNYVWDETTVGDVSKLIDANLPPEATTEEIYAFLESRDLPSGPIAQARDHSYLADSGVPPRTSVITTIFRNTSPPAFLVREDIIVYFILDGGSRLDHYIVQEVYTGF